jgi:hypothetical protein
MSRSSPWPTSWRGSPGRCCSAGNRLTPTRYPWPRRDSFGWSESAGRASGVCERMTTRWPDSQTALRKPGAEHGARRRRVYEDRGARISILAGRRPPRPDTLKQTDQPPISTNPCRRGGPYVFNNVDVKRTLGSPGLALFIEALRYRSQFWSFCAARKPRLHVILSGRPPPGGPESSSRMSKGCAKQKRLLSVRIGIATDRFRAHRSGKSVRWRSLSFPT